MVTVKQSFIENDGHQLFLLYYLILKFKFAILIIFVLYVWLKIFIWYLIVLFFY